MKIIFTEKNTKGLKYKIQKSKYNYNKAQSKQYKAENAIQGRNISNIRIKEEYQIMVNNFNLKIPNVLNTKNN